MTMPISNCRTQAGSSGCHPAIAMSGPTYQMRSAIAIRPTIASTQRLKTSRRSLRMAAGLAPHALDRERDVDPSVARAVGRGLIRGDRLRVAVAFGAQTLRGNAVGAEQEQDRARALLRQVPVRREPRDRKSTR